MDSLLEQESSLRTAAEPHMPDSPAPPFQLADANPAPPVPDAQTPSVEGGLSSPPLPKAPTAEGGLSDLPPTPMEGGLSSPPLPNVPTVEGALPLPNVPAMEGGLSSPPLPNAPTVEGELSSPPLPEGLASKLAQSEAIAGGLNLAITPATNRLKDKLEEHPQRPAAPKAAAKMGYAPVPRAAKPLPEVAAFLARLDHPEAERIMCHNDPRRGTIGDV